MITSHVTLQHNERTYEYQLNYTMAIKLCCMAANGFSLWINSHTLYFSYLCDKHSSVLRHRPTFLTNKINPKLRKVRDLWTFPFYGKLIILITSLLLSLFS